MFCFAFELVLNIFCIQSDSKVAPKALGHFGVIWSHLEHIYQTFGNRFIQLSQGGVWWVILSQGGEDSQKKFDKHKTHNVSYKNRLSNFDSSLGFSYLSGPLKGSLIKYTTVKSGQLGTNCFARIFIFIFDHVRYRNFINVLKYSKL